MLYKHGTAAAKEARLTGPAAPESQTITAEPAAPMQEPVADPRDLAIARLEAEQKELQRQIEQLQASWQTELAKAEARAREAAAREHVQDDEARLATLAKALSDARQGFDAALGQNQADLTIQLAIEGLSRLVEPNRHDGEWLARAIHRRLDELRTQSVVSLRVAPDALSPEALAQLRQSLTAGTIIEADPYLKHGQARIELQLGVAQVNLTAGLASLVAQLEASNVEA